MHELSSLFGCLHIHLGPLLTAPCSIISATPAEPPSGIVDTRKAEVPAGNRRQTKKPKKTKNKGAARK